MSSYPEGRFYEAEFPELDDVVVVQVKRIVDMGAYVTLLEYDGREGMMLLSELSKRRIRSVAKLLRVGRTEICMVLRVDKDKGYIDLSKRRVDPEDATAKEESFAKAKAVHSIMRHVAAMNKINVEELCKKTSWLLHNKYPSAFEAFRKHINEEINLWDEIDFSQPGEDLTHLADKIKEDIETNLRRKLIQQVLRLRAKIEVSCSEYEGIDAIRAALLKGLEPSKEDCEIKINLVAHPLFVVTCTCRDKAVGFAAIEESMKLVKDCIEEKKGEFRIDKMPVQIGANDRDGEGEGEEGEGDSDEDDKSSEERSDMGDIDDAAMKELMEKTKDLDVDNDDEDEK